MVATTMFPQLILITSIKKSKRSFGQSYYMLLRFFLVLNRCPCFLNVKMVKKSKLNITVSAQIKVKNTASGEIRTIIFLTLETRLPPRVDRTFFVSITSL